MRKPHIIYQHFLFMQVLGTDDVCTDVAIIIRHVGSGKKYFFHYSTYTLF